MSPRTTPLKVNSDEYSESLDFLKACRTLDKIMDRLDKNFDANPNSEAFQMVTNIWEQTYNVAKSMAPKDLRNALLYSMDENPERAVCPLLQSACRLFKFQHVLVSTLRSNYETKPYKMLTLNRSGLKTWLS